MKLIINAGLSVLVNTIIVSSISLSASLVFAEDKASIPEQGKVLIQSFANALKIELQGAIKQGGLTNAIDVCSEKAPAIAQQYSDSQWQIKRTSLKVRNPANAPTEFERNILLQFQVKKTEGMPVNKLSYYHVESADKGKMHRLMKAIPTQALCLGCHGDKVSDEVKNELQSRYPADQAVGFKERDIRGAFSLVYKELVPQD